MLLFPSLSSLLLFLLKVAKKGMEKLLGRFFNFLIEVVVSCFFSAPHFYYYYSYLRHVHIYVDTLLR